MLISLAEQLLLHVKKGGDYTTTNRQLAGIDPRTLLHVKGDNAKKAFWTNIYNAWYLILEHRKVPRKQIFKQRLVVIAGEHFSLDEIEHGILRRRKWKVSFGYLRSPFYRKIIKNLALQKDDYRIHFALNCGLMGCPPIAFYHADKIEEELTLATVSFLETETEVNHKDCTLLVSKLLKWYIGDFGGKTGIRKMLRQYGIIEENISYPIIFKSYDTTPALGNFRS